MSRKYLASLAFAAVVVLAVGVLLRNRLLRAEAPTPAPPSEASALQQLSQEGQLRRLSDFISERVTAVAPLVTYVPEAGAAGIRWGQGDTLVTTLPGKPVAVVRASVRDSVRRQPTLAADSARREWVLVVGRTPSGAVVSSAGMLGGTTLARCGDRQLTEYVISAVLHDGFAGAGLFDLAGRTLGMIVRCGGRPVAIPTREVARVLADTGSVPTRVWDLYGLGFAPLDDWARDYFDSDSGMLVTAVQRGGRADAAGLRPGDMLLALDERPLAEPQDLAPLGDPSSESHRITRRRGTAVARVDLARASGDQRAPADSTRAADIGIQVVEPLAPEGVAIGTVRAGSPAAAAGLRAGDRLLRFGNRDVSSPAAARRLLGQTRDGPAFIVFERDSVLRGVLLPR